MRPIFLTPCQPRYRIFRIGLDDANITRCVLHDVILGVVEKRMPGRIDQLRKFGMSYDLYGERVNSYKVGIRSSVLLVYLGSKGLVYHDHQL